MALEAPMSVREKQHILASGNDCPLPQRHVQCFFPGNFFDKSDLAFFGFLQRASQSRRNLTSTAGGGCEPVRSSLRTGEEHIHKKLSFLQGDQQQASSMGKPKRRSTTHSLSSWTGSSFWEDHSSGKPIVWTAFAHSGSETKTTLGLPFGFRKGFSAWV